MAPPVETVGEIAAVETDILRRFKDGFDLEAVMPKTIDRFFSVGRLSVTGASPIGALPPIMREVRFTPEESRIYKPWLALSAAQIADRAANKTQPEKARLRQMGDPLMLFLDYMFKFQEEKYPDMSRDIKTMDKARTHGAQVLRSLHGRPKYYS